MGLFDKLEQRLERTVNGAFAKAFRSEVQPVEIASAMRRAMDNKATSIGKNQRPIVPNVFDVELSSGDFARLTAYREELSDELVASALEHADTQRYTAGGPVAVTFTENTDLETGVFEVRPATAKHVEGLEAVRPAEPEDDESDDAPNAEQQDAPAPGHPRQDADGRHPNEAADAPEQAVAETHDEQHGTSHGGGAPLPGAGADTWFADRAGHADQHQHQAPAPADPSRSSVPNPQPVVPARPPRAPRPKPRPWLEIDGERYPLTTALTVIGRDDSADIVLDDPGISRQHTEFRVTHDGPHLIVSLRDLGSTNGTFVNGDQVSRARLMNGDRVTVGRTTFTIHMGGRR